MKMTMSLLGLLRLHRFSRKLSKTDCRMDTRIQVLYTCFFVFFLLLYRIFLWHEYEYEDSQCCGSERCSLS